MFRWFVFLVALLAIPVWAGPDDDFIIVYQLIQQTDAQRELGQFAAAREGYEQAQDLLRALKKGYPQWNERVIAYRLRYVAEKLASLPAPAIPPSAAVVGEAATVPTQPANEVLTQFNALNGEIAGLRVEKQRLEAKLREALTAQPAPVDPKELLAAVDRIAQLQNTNKVLLGRLEAQQAERKNLVEKVLFDEAQQALTAASQQLASQREKTVELERLRNLTEGELKRLREVEVKELKSENSTLKNQVDALRSDTERGQQIANLTERLSKLQTKFEEAQRENDLIAADRKKLEQQLQELRARQSDESVVRIKQLETDLALARAETDRHATTAAQLEEKLVRETGSRTRLEGENKELTTRVESLSEQVAGVKALQNQLTAEQQERIELENQLRLAEDRLALLSTVPAPNSGPLDRTEGSIPDPVLVGQLQMLETETGRLRDALKESRSRQTELSNLLAEAGRSKARIEAEKRELTKSLSEIQSTPTQKQIAKANRTIKSLEERLQSVEKERDQLEQRLAQAVEKSKSGLQFARRARLGNPREDAQRFRAERSN